jgi:hypothetical protein
MTNNRKASDLTFGDAVQFEDEGNVLTSTTSASFPINVDWTDTDEQPDNTIGWALDLASGHSLMLEGPDEEVRVP